MHNHARRIAYYREFVAAHPDYPRGYLWLLDDLIADGRLTEARDYLEKMARVDDSYRVPLYRGKILRAEGRLDEACACWTEMEAGFPDEWLVSLSLGDLAAELQDYDAAERYYRRVLTQQAPPRYVDALESLAILGLLGAVCSFFLEWGLYEAIRGAIASSGQLSFLHVVSFSTVALPVALVCVVTGLLIGVVGSLMSIRKFLKV